MSDFHHRIAADLISAVLIMALVSPLWLSAAWRPPGAARSLLKMAGLYLVYTLLNHSLGVSAQRLLPLRGLEFNWMGKILALGAGWLWMRRQTPGERQALGWTTRIREGTWPFALALTAAALTIRAGALLLSQAPPDAVNAEALAYQASLPGLAEEIWHRSILLGLLNQIFPPRMRILGTPFGAGLLITSLLFGLEHGIGVIPATLSVSFNAFAFARTTATGFLVYGLLRERTGSLIPAVAAHNLTNAISPLAGLIRP